MLEDKQRMKREIMERKKKHKQGAWLPSFDESLGLFFGYFCL